MMRPTDAVTMVGEKLYKGVVLPLQWAHPQRLQRRMLMRPAVNVQNPQLLAATPNPS
jgi:hypothetical protein